MLVGVLPPELHIPLMLVHLLMQLPKNARADVTRHAEQAHQFCEMLRVLWAEARQTPIFLRTMTRAMTRTPHCGLNCHGSLTN